MNGAWSLSTREAVTGLSWQTGWLPVFFGLGLRIYCCARSSSCGRFSMPSSVTQKWVVHMHTWILCSFFVLLVAQTTVCCVCRWSNGSLVPWERDAGLSMVDVTCVISMSWIMSSCHASAKATRSLCCYFVSYVACPLVTGNLQNAALLEPVCRWQCRTWPTGIMGVYKCHVLNTCTDVCWVDFIISCIFPFFPSSSIVVSGCIQVHELLPLTAAHSGCQKRCIFCRVPIGCSHRLDDLWRGCSCSGTRALINHAAWSVYHSVQVHISVISHF